MHPYTLGLLKSIPRLEDDDSKRLYMIKGMVPNPLEMPPGCHFSDRCDSCMDVCRTKVPSLWTSTAIRCAASCTRAPTAK